MSNYERGKAGLFCWDKEFAVGLGVRMAKTSSNQVMSTIAGAPEPCWLSRWLGHMEASPVV